MQLYGYRKELSLVVCLFFFSSRRRHTRFDCDWSSDVCSSDLALWATQRLLPLKKGGEFARGLERGRKATLALFEKLHADARFVTAFAPELDIVVFAPRAASVSETSVLSRKMFEAAAKRGLHLAVAELPIRLWEENLRVMKRDRETMTCLRSVLMKPEHLDWVDKIWEELSGAALAALRN